jgi:hypothetical protein
MGSRRTAGVRATRHIYHGGQVTDPNVGTSRVRRTLGAAGGAAIAALLIFGACVSNKLQTTRTLPPRLPAPTSTLTNEQLNTLMAGTTFGTAVPDDQVDASGNTIRITLAPQTWSHNLNPKKNSADWASINLGFVIGRLTNTNATLTDVVFDIPPAKEAVWVLEKDGANNKVNAVIVLYDPAATPSAKVTILEPHKPEDNAKKIKHKPCKHDKPGAAEAQFRAWDYTCDPADDEGKGLAGPGPGGLAGTGAVGAEEKREAKALSAWITCELGCCTLGE